MAKIGRNAPCPCGSGKKYKKCCLAKEEEERRSRLEEQERRQLQAARQAEEERDLYEDALDEEEADEDFCDDDIDDLDQDEEEEEEEDEERDETSEDSKPERRPRRKVPEESPQISEAEAEIVDKWWEEYKNMRGIEKIRQHLEDFLRDHPKLVPNLELHMEVLFELGADYVREGRHAEYIDLLLKMRSQFADSYLKSFGAYDRDIISYQIATGRKHEAVDFLNYFREYPGHDPDNLFKIIELMMANNCQEMVTDLVQDIYYEVCTCSGILGGDELIDILMVGHMAPFLKPDFTRADLEELASRLRTIRIPLEDEFYQPDFLGQHFERILTNRKNWTIGDCKTRSEIFNRYYQVSLAFMGFLHECKGKDWLAADFYRKMALRYLVYVVPEGKRPRETFVFTKNKIESTLAKTCRSYFFLHSTAVIVSLDSLYWFAEYLEESDSITEERRTAIQTWCTELYHQVFPGLLRTEVAAKAFERFPL